MQTKNSNVMLARQSGRKRFPAWLYDIVDKGEVEGVRWYDSNKTVFTVPWTRVDSPHFDPKKHAMVFQLWAEFTGRYKQGERADPSVWKTRFRCAIRKMAEIEEITLAHNLEEKNGKEPFRVFRFKTNALNGTKRKDGKKPRKARSSKKIKPLNHIDQIHRNKTSRLTAARTVSQSWFQHDIVSHGVTHDAVALDHRKSRNCAMRDCVTASNASTDQQYWPVFSSPAVSSRSYQKIIFADFSIQQPVFGMDNQMLPGNNYVIPSAMYDHTNATYYYDNDSNVEGKEEGDYFPRISPEDVNSVLQSCSTVTSHDITNPLQPSVMTSQKSNNALQSCSKVTSQDSSAMRSGMLVDGVRTSSLTADEEWMAAACREYLVLDDHGYQESRAAAGESDLNDLAEILDILKTE